jgi:hypothetical protein
MTLIRWPRSARVFGNSRGAADSGPYYQRVAVFLFVMSVEVHCSFGGADLPFK